MAWYNSLPALLFYQSITLIWLIWFRHNKILHENCNWLDEYWIKKSLDTAQSCLSVTGNSASTHETNHLINRGQNRWKRPTGGRIKLNVDVRINQNNWIGLGVVARNTEGRIVGCGVRRLELSVSPLVAEALGVSFGMQMAIQRRWQAVEVESDCLQLINLIKERVCTRHGDGVLIEEILWLRRQFKECVWLHTGRDNNKAAHNLAGFDPGPYANTRVWIDTLPNLFVDDVNSE